MIQEVRHQTKLTEDPSHNRIVLQVGLVWLLLAIILRIVLPGPIPRGAGQDWEAMRRSPKFSELGRFSGV